MECNFKCNGRPIISFIFFVSILYADSCVFDVYHEDVQLKISEVKQNGTPSLSVNVPVDECVKEQYCPCTIQFQYHGYVAIFTREDSCFGYEYMELLSPNNRIGTAIHFRGSVDVKQFSRFSMCVKRGALHCGNIELLDDRITWQYVNSTKTSNNSDVAIAETESYRYDRITWQYVNSTKTSNNSDVAIAETESYRWAAFGGAGTVGIIVIVLFFTQRQRFKQTEQSQHYDTLTPHESHHYDSLHITPAER